MKKIWIILIVLVVLVALGFVGFLVYDEFFYDDDEYYDDEYEDEEYDDQEDIDNEENYEDDEDYEDEDYEDEDSDNEDEEDIDNDNESENTESVSREATASLTNLIVLLNFEDQQLETSESDWADFYFGSGNSVGTYFDAMSKGSFEILAASESYGTENNGVVIVNIDKSHPNITSESSDEDFEVLTKIFEEMLEKVDEYIDFSQYDANNDGNVLASELSITMIAAGYEENEFSISENQVSGICINEDYFTQVDGVGIGDYIVCGELEMLDGGEAEMVTVGVACHETAHVLGLPDLYDTDYSSIGLGFHALMSEGNNNRKTGERLGETPSPLIAWSKMYVGFLQPELVDSDGVYKLYGQSTDNYNVIKINEGNGYYLIENVDFGGYGAGIEEYMDHSGIAIWYINEDVVTEDNILNNDINNDETNRGVILIEAEGSNDLVGEALEYDNPDYDHYFASGHIDEYTTDEGMVIKILDAPGKEMEVEITLN